MAGSVAAAAMVEVGRAQRTIFIARYPRSRELQREINDGLNVMESWNSANAVIFYGKRGDLASNRREEQELSVLCLRVLQSALVCVNTLMLQDILAGDEIALEGEDRRGLTPLFGATSKWGPSAIHPLALKIPAAKLKKGVVARFVFEAEDDVYVDNVLVDPYRRG